jgi:hypothetical protein
VGVPIDQPTNSVKYDFCSRRLVNYATCAVAIGMNLLLRHGKDTDKETTLKQEPEG